MQNFRRTSARFGQRGVFRDLGRLLAPWAAASAIAGFGLNSTALAGGEPTSSTGRDNADGNDGGGACAFPENGAPGGGGPGLGMAVPAFAPAGPTIPHPAPGTDGPAMSGMGPKGSELLSDPIDFSIGDFTTSCVDLSIRGRGFDFEFKRTYRGNDSLWFEYEFPKWDESGPSGVLKNSSIGPMGAQWDHSYSMLVYTQNDPTMVANPPVDWPHPNLIKDGRIDAFSVEIGDAPGSYVWGHPDLDGTMQFVPEDQQAGITEDRFIYKTAAGGEYLFKYFGFEGNSQLVDFGLNAGGWYRLAEIKDRNNNKLTVAYADDTARIDYIDDTLGNRIDFRYEHPENAYLLTSIVDETGGRTVSYTYYRTNRAVPCFKDYDGDPCDDGGGARLDSSIGLVAGITEITDLQIGQIGGTPLENTAWAYVLESVTMPEVGYDDQSAVYSAMPSDLEHNNRYSGGRVWNYSYDMIAIDGLDDDCAEEYDAIRLKTITDPSGTVILNNHYKAFAVDDGPLRGRPYIWRQDAPDDDAGNPVSYLYDYETGLNFDNDGETDDYRVTISTKRRQIVELDYVSEELRRRDSEGSFFCFDTGANSALDGWGRSANILVARRHKTGYATDASPFTISVPKDRPIDDSESEYLTTYTRNENWKLTNVVLPDGLSVSMGYGYNSIGQGSQIAATAYERAFKKLAVTTRTRTGTGGLMTTESWSYDHDFGGCCGSNFPTEYIDANGNKTVYTYDSRGNVEKIERGVVGSNAVSTERFEYDPVTGDLTKHIHPERWVDDGAGGSISVSRSDVYEYYSGGVGNGRLWKVTVDHGGKNLETEFVYDAIGNVLKIIQPNDNYKTMIWNQAGQIVREQWWGPASDTLPATTLLAWREYFYDNRGNPVRTDELAADVPNPGTTRAIGSADPGLWSITLNEYDSLNNLVRTARRLSVALNNEGTTLPAPDSNGAYSLDPGSTSWDPTQWAITEYEYDNNKNLTVVRYPEAVAAEAETDIQVANGQVTTYDERDMPLRQFDGIALFENADFPASTSNQANDPLPVIRYMDYDLAGNLVKTSMLDPDDETVESRTRFTTYDDLNRVKTRTDPMGNRTTYTYDANDNVTTVEVDGQGLDDGGIVGQQLLAATKTTYDALNRPYLQEVAVFDIGAPNPPMDAASVTKWQWTHTAYNPDSSVHTVSVPAGKNPAPSYTAPGDVGATVYLYDSASRLARLTTPDGSASLFVYDDNSNLTTQTAVDHSSLDSTVETYTTTHGYDGMNRRTRTVQGDYGTSGPKNTTVMVYDSRSNLIESTDPRTTLTAYYYDGLSRRVQTKVDGSGLDIDTIVGYDRSSRLTSLTDDNGNTTSYQFDSLGREILRTYADGTTHTTVYDKYGNPEVVTDARGVVTTNFYDENDRLVGREFDRTSAAFVGGSSIDDPNTNENERDEVYEYDGLGRVVIANNEFALVSRSYDSRGLLLSETTNTDMENGFPSGQGGGSDSRRTVTNSYDLAGNLVRCVYPSGRDVHREYDLMNRVTGIWDDDGTTIEDIAAYEYLGVGRVHQRRTGSNSVGPGNNGVVQTSYQYAGHSTATSIAGDFGFRSVREIRHERVAGTELIEGRSFTWDSAGNKTGHNDLRPSATGRKESTLTYDAANRLTISDTAFPGNPSQDGTVTYALDGVHNRTGVTLTGMNTSGSPVGVYKDDQGNNAALNQYSITPRLDGGAYDFEHGYDFNGNLILLVEHPRTADVNDDYVLDLSDVNAFTVALQAGDLAVDFNGDGEVNGADQDIFTAAFTGGPAGGFYNASFEYDQRNQLVGFSASRGGTPIKSSAYRYDCFNRRVATIIESSDSDPNTPNGRTAHFVYAGQAAWQLIEEYGTGADPTADRSYVYGLYIDEVLTLHDYGSLEDFYYHQDDLFSVYALTDDSGTVVERYAYGDYGQVTVTDGSGMARTESSYGNTHAYTGRTLCNELVLDDGGQILGYRNRYMIATTGRFLQRDPLSYSGGSMNLYDYTNCRPDSLLDPMGLSPYCAEPGCQGDPTDAIDDAKRSHCNGRPGIFNRRYNYQARSNRCWEYVHREERVRGGFSRCVAELLHGCCMKESKSGRSASRSRDRCVSNLFKYRQRCGDVQPPSYVPMLPCWANCTACVAALAGLGVAGGVSGPAGWVALITAAVGAGIALPTVCVDCLACI